MACMWPKSPFPNFSELSLHWLVVDDSIQTIAIHQAVVWEAPEAQLGLSENLIVILSSQARLELETLPLLVSIHEDLLLPSANSEN